MKGRKEGRLGSRHSKSEARKSEVKMRSQIEKSKLRSQEGRTEGRKDVMKDGMKEDRTGIHQEIKKKEG